MPQMLYQGQVASLPGVQPHQSIFEESSTPEAALGQELVLRDGKKFVYAKAGAVALVAGTLQQSAANGGGTTVQKNMTLATAAVVGEDHLHVTLVTDSCTANQFADGSIGVYSTTNPGLCYQIDNHAAGTAGATVQFNLKDRVVQALATTAKITLAKHACDGTIIYPTTATGIPIGVAPIDVTAAYYYWCQTLGDCICLADGAWTYGTDLLASNAVAGALEVDDAAKAQAYVGNARIDAADTTYGLCFLRLGR